MSKSVLIQERLRRALPTVLGCRDYQEQEELLVRVDRVLRVSGVEWLFAGLSLERYQAVAGGGGHWRRASHSAGVSLLYLTPCILRLIPLF